MARSAPIEHHLVILYSRFEMSYAWERACCLCHEHAKYADFIQRHGIDYLVFGKDLVFTHLEQKSYNWHRELRWNWGILNTTLGVPQSMGPAYLRGSLTKAIHIGQGSIEFKRVFFIAHTTFSVSRDRSLTFLTEDGVVDVTDHTLRPLVWVEWRAADYFWLARVLDHAPDGPVHGRLCIPPPSECGRHGRDWTSDLDHSKAPL